MQILLVDDDKFILKTMSDVLSQENYDVIECNNGKEALDVFNEKDIDLLITDIYMQDDGIQLISEIRKTQRKIPMIAMSGGSIVDNNHVLLDVAGLMGATKMEKPISRDDLLNTVKELLNAN